MHSYNSTRIGTYLYSFPIYRRQNLSPGTPMSKITAGSRPVSKNNVFFIVFLRRLYLYINKYSVVLSFLKCSEISITHLFWRYNTYNIHMPNIYETPSCAYKYSIKRILSIFLTFIDSMAQNKRKMNVFFT